MVVGIEHIKELVDDSIKNVNAWDPEQIKSGHIVLKGKYYKFFPTNFLILIN